MQHFLSLSRQGRVVVFDCLDQTPSGEILERDACILSRPHAAESALLRITKSRDFSHSETRRSTTIQARDEAAENLAKFDGNVSVTHQNDALKMLPSDIYLPRKKPIAVMTEAFVFFIARSELKNWRF